MTADPTLALIWAFLIAFAVFMYVVMDGFDLGIGILFPAFGVGSERDQAMNAIAPVWDGNETWLVLGGGGLMAAFPLAFAVLMPAMYPPIIAMLLGLVFRGVAFEFRWRDPRHRAFWDFAFTAGSVTAALAQGIVLGALLQGVKVTGRGYGGGWLDWLTPFSLLTGIGVVAGYALLGSCWLIFKTDGATQGRAFRLARIAGVATALAVTAVSAATPFLEQRYYERWLTFPSILFAGSVPVLVAALSIGFWWALLNKKELMPFLLTLGLYLLCFAGLGASMYPDIVPGAVSIVQAASPAKSQTFMLIGAGLMIPIILAYTAWSYWVFRGKVGDAGGYH
ncbi:cytochrome d ubiquinol oxidase subunit II [Sphingomonas sp.]|jgi:cytochrome d ubiquinol oxidase subunit II|uniref:cytochrome d ubiquinol oxidase subunit II n=1 Tax=Sphingomonas sp. TaxID=28214 RepID=UPI002E34A8ED|nr:cytochrome d ubiquinol oxidase subunit II [Sphingomonas sp.]HEX4695945.1 cytochrome d ubiquinol oxidase subunit II [Sphingomonas sp.]